MEDAAERSAAVPWLVALAAIVGLTALFLIGAGHLPLGEPDEARCALVSRHMIESGDWLAPYLMDGPYLNKPPLFFWMLAGCMKAFPGSAWALRLASALIGAVTVVLTGILAGQFYNRRAGLLAGATFAVSAAGFVGSRLVRMDMLLAMWMAATLLCWSRAYILGRSRRWYLGMYVCMAMGCLTKGPLAILLPGLVILIHVTLEGFGARGEGRGARGEHGPLGRTVAPNLDKPRASAGFAACCWRDFLAMRPLAGALIVAVIYGSWVVYMTWRYPGYLNKFFVEQNLGHFAGESLDIVTSRFTSVGAFIGGLMPWTVMMALACWRLRPRKGIPAGERLLWTWGLAVVGFFSLAKIQLPLYVLPAFPSAFVLLGAYLADGRKYPREILGGLLATFVLAAGVLIAWPFAEKMQFGQTNMLLAAVRIAALPVLAGFTWWLGRRRPAAAAIPLVVGCALVSVDLVERPLRQVFASRSAAALVEPLRHLAPTAEPVVMTPLPIYSLAYYAPPGWRFRAMHSQDVLRELEGLLKADHDRYAVMGRPLLDMLTGAKGIQLDLDPQLDVRRRLTILAGDDSQVLVRISRFEGGAGSAVPK